MCVLMTVDIRNINYGMYVHVKRMHETSIWFSVAMMVLSESSLRDQTPGMWDKGTQTNEVVNVNVVMKCSVRWSRFYLGEFINEWCSYLSEGMWRSRETSRGRTRWFEDHAVEDKYFCFLVKNLRNGRKSTRIQTKRARICEIKSLKAQDSVCWALLF